MLRDFLLPAVLLVIVFGMNVKATVLVVNDPITEPQQRTMQLLLVWILPILGAIVVFAVHRPAEKSSGKYKEAPELEEDIEFSRFGGRGRSHEGADDD
jgi:hypothetical protein